jgi:hypothetical protein
VSPGLCVATLVLLAAGPAAEPALRDLQLRVPDRPEWWRREVAGGRPLDPNLERGLRTALATLAAPDWGRALTQPERMTLWDLGAGSNGLRHVGFRGHRRFEDGMDPAEWEGMLLLNPETARVLTIEAWPVNQAELSVLRLARYRRSTRWTLDLGFLRPLGRMKPPPRVHDLRMEFLEDGTVLEQRRTAKLKSSSGASRERTSVRLQVWSSRPGAAVESRLDGRR